MRRRLVLAMIVLALPLLAASPAAAAPPPIKHVFVIVLENKGFDTTFGPGSQAPYLSQQLTSQGELLTQYYGIGHASLDNYIAMVSGQAPAIVTQADCPFYTDFFPATIGSDGQAIGQRCGQPATVNTAADGFLQTWVPKITGSPAWGDGSLLVVTFDEADTGDASSCCGETPGPNSPNPGGTTQGNGGGRIGAVLLSQYVQPGSTDATPYNHYSQ